MQINIFPTTLWYLERDNRHPDDALNWALNHDESECVERSNRGGFQSPSRDFSEFPYLSYLQSCLLYTSPSPRDVEESRMPSSA